MTDIDVATLSDVQVLALTGAAEARSYLDLEHGWRPAPLRNMEAVMCTPINRVAADAHRFGATVKEACLRHAQYSCWNVASGTNHDWLRSQAEAMRDGKSIAPIIQQCLVSAEKLIEQTLADLVNGATHYYAPLSMVPANRTPDWAIGKLPCARVGDHLFFKGV